MLATSEGAEQAGKWAVGLISLIVILDLQIQVQGVESISGMSFWVGSEK